MSDRYSRALDLAADLAAWQQLATDGSGSSKRRRAAYIEAPNAPLVPRGLRSFDREDGDFFLRLIPGPKERDGLPAVISFWKRRIETLDNDETFKVGVLYGPSGCGKSSLVKAGLLPRLSTNILPLHIETTSHDTEGRLLKAIRKAFPLLKRDTDLDEALRLLRQSPELRGGKKLLIVLDQFEQWLHAWQTGANAEMVRALRQCDGGNVQTMLMVRDDFWLPLSRLMRNVEVSIVEGDNGMLVDSFDPEHARRVLRELGVAYGRIPEIESSLSAECSAFLDQAIVELAEDSRLYPIRLSVFVEMVKDRVWTPATLHEMGGTEGVGVAFLENSVGGQASSARRIHEPAIRRILLMLLPPSGQIKGCVRTRSELLRASEYHSRLHDFDMIIRTLDVELRLITPTQSQAGESGDQSRDDSDSHPEVVYQLTHDFLVPSIREWLERQSRATRKGRVQLLLQEQTEIWNGRPLPRYLPTLIEWMSIRWQTSRREWTEPQRRMLRAAAQRHLRSTLKAILVLTIGLATVLLIISRLNRQRSQSEAQRLVSKLQDVSIVDVPHVVQEIKPYEFWSEETLRKVFSDPAMLIEQRLRAALALLPNDASLVGWLTNQLMDEQTPTENWLVIRTALTPHHEVASRLLLAELADSQTKQRVRFRIACALAELDNNPEFWETMGDEVSHALLTEPATDARDWIAALRPAGEKLRAPLISILSKVCSQEVARTGTLALFELSSGQVDDLVEVLALAEAPQYRATMELLKRNPAHSLEVVMTQHAQLLANSSETLTEEHRTRQLANFTLATWELGDPRLLQENSLVCPDPQMRTRLLRSMTTQWMDLEAILPLVLETDADDPVLNLALLATTFHVNEPISTAVRARLQSRLGVLYRSANDPEVHSVSGLLLRRLGDARLEDVDRDFAAVAPAADRGWWVNKSLLKMVVLELAAPSESAVLPSDSNRPKHRFGIASTEVTVEVYKEFDPTYIPDSTLREKSDKTPATMLLAVQMAEFCNWLSKRDAIPPDQWCYPVELTVLDCHPLPDAMQKIGYRLPSTAEWDYACGCGSTAVRFYGDNQLYLNDYSWNKMNSGLQLRTVADQLPNPFGLFDTYGNAEEICISGLETWQPTEPPTYVSKGGDSLKRIDSLSTPFQRNVDFRDRREFGGFRVARTLAVEPIENSIESD